MSDSNIESAGISKARSRLSVDHFSDFEGKEISSTDDISSIYRNTERSDDIRYDRDMAEKGTLNALSSPSCRDSSTSLSCRSSCSLRSNTGPGVMMRTNSVLSQDSISRGPSLSPFDFTTLVVIQDIPGTKIAEVKPSPIGLVSPPVATGIVRSSTSRLNELSPPCTGETGSTNTGSEGEKRLQGRFSRRFLEEKSDSFKGIENFKQKRPKVLKRAYSARLMNVPEGNNDCLVVPADVRKSMSHSDGLGISNISDRLGISHTSMCSTHSCRTSSQSMSSQTSYDMETPVIVSQEEHKKSTEHCYIQTTSDVNLDDTTPGKEEKKTLEDVSENIRLTHYRGGRISEPIVSKSSTVQTQIHAQKIEYDTNRSSKTVSRSVSTSDMNVSKYQMMTHTRNPNKQRRILRKGCNCSNSTSNMQTLTYHIISGTEDVDAVKSASIKQSPDRATCDTKNWLGRINPKLENNKSLIKTLMENTTLKDIKHHDYERTSASDTMALAQDNATMMHAETSIEEEEQWTLKQLRERRKALQKSLSYNEHNMRRAHLQLFKDNTSRNQNVSISRGQIQFSMQYYNPSMTFRVTLMKASDIELSTKSSKSTTLFAKVSLKPGKYKKTFSKKVIFSENPEFFEDFDFPNMHIGELLDMHLKISLFKKDGVLSFPKLIGEAYTSMINYDVYFGKTLWKTLRAPSNRVCASH